VVHRSIQAPTIRRLAIAVRGVIQGVGFRPFVYNAARSCGLSGWVKNEADTVRIEVQGETAELDAFLEALRSGHPPQARIDAIEVRDAVCEGESAAAATFQILPGSGAAAPRPTIPADLATCGQCLEEIRTPGERRYRYPFTNCTACGPRWSIIRRLPYDRPRTSMDRFAMCPDCRAEYENPSDRRFHAQPIACPRCGPALRLLDGNGREGAVGDEALSAAVEALRGGRIVALKGLGGFQLLVDATDADAVARLRQRKQRPDRPFAVMIASLDGVRRCCEVGSEEAAVLTSPEAPIVLLRRRRAADGQDNDVTPGVAPGNPYLGVMLPYTPLHHLLLAGIDRPIVCTSGNLAEEPMAVTTNEAVERLGAIPDEKDGADGVASHRGIADLILTHNRPIVRPVDDSVVRIDVNGLLVLRRARGFAPLPIDLDFEGPTVLAVGGHLKNTVALSLRRVRETHRESPRAPETLHGTDSDDDPSVRSTHPTPVVLSPHVGDLDSVLSVEVHRRAVADLVDFFEAAPEVVACDLHPDYASTRHAEALAARWDVPLLRVQHHHAHVAACMAEHRLTGPVLGLSWDGTGYGTDGTVWGGEALLCEGSTFTRVAHLRTFALPGGDRAVREPRRSALGLLYEILGDEAARYARDWFQPAEVSLLLSALKQALHAPRTSSMGRLFDAVAALCGLPAVISFEGQAAMALEYAADADEREAYALPLSDALPAVADWEPLVRAVLRDRAAGEPVGRISGRFHNALAEMAVAVARRSGCSQVALTGGCFQNALLTERIHSRLTQSGFNVFTHRSVPPGDGGIALGQVFVAAVQAELSRKTPM